MTHVIEELSPPGEVLAEFYPAGMKQATILDGGKVNTTYKVTDSRGEPSILQRLGQSTDPAMSEDYAVVAGHLERAGWEVAIPLHTAREELIVVDEAGRNWRSYSYIESDQCPPPDDMTSLTAFAKMLGSLSFSLSSLEYAPQHSIPNFHDAGHIVEHLISQLPDMTSPDQHFSGILIDYLSEEEPIQPGNVVIHGDPKLANALFRNGEPFTMVDWDTLMKGNPMLDLADMLRSITGKLRETPANVDANTLVPLIRAYQEEAGIPETVRSEHVDEAITATRAMCLMLSIRYMSDTVDKSYFEWDPSSYPDAPTHNRTQARWQLENFQALR